MRDVFDVHGGPEHLEDVQMETDQVMDILLYHVTSMLVSGQWSMISILLYVTFGSMGDVWPGLYTKTCA